MTGKFKQVKGSFILSDCYISVPIVYPLFSSSHPVMAHLLSENRPYIKTHSHRTEAKAKAKISFNVWNFFFGLLRLFFDLFQIGPRDFPRLFVLFYNIFVFVFRQANGWGGTVQSGCGRHGDPGCYGNQHGVTRNQGRYRHQSLHARSPTTEREYSVWWCVRVYVSVIVWLCVRAGMRAGNWYFWLDTLENHWKTVINQNDNNNEKNFYKKKINIARKPWIEC